MTLTASRQRKATTVTAGTKRKRAQKFCARLPQPISRRAATDRPNALVESVAHVAEGAAQVAAQDRQSADADDRNQGCDEAILDGGRTVLVLQECAKLGKHDQVSEMGGSKIHQCVARERTRKCPYKRDRSPEDILPIRRDPTPAD